MGASSRGVVNFSAGEVSPKLRGRYDSVPYYAGHETLENVLVTNFGSVFRTPGTKHVARTKYQNKDARLIAFKFSLEQSYQMELGDLYFRFFRNSASIVETAKTITGITKANPAVVTSGAHGYSNGDFVDIDAVVGMTQVNNKRFKVANVAANTFELQDEDGNNINSSSYTTYSSGGTAERVYQIVSPYLETNLSSIKYTQQNDIMYIVDGAHAPQKLSRLTATTFSIAPVNFVGGPFLPENITATTITPSADTGTGITLTASAATFQAGHVGALWRVKDGVVKITGFTSTTIVTGDVQAEADGTAGDLGTGPAATDDWAEGAWSTVRGFPTDVKIFEQSCYYMATTYEGLKVWGSVPEEYENFTPGVTASDSLTYRLGSASADRLLWMYPTTSIIIGCGSGPFTFSSVGDARISPVNTPSVRQQNENGSNSVSPVRIGPFVYYVERNGTILGQLTYSLETNSFDTKDMTRLSDHILGDGVVDLAIQNYPNNILWALRSDGVLATLAREVEDNIRSWTRQVFAGTAAAVKSVSTNPNGKEDQVWFIVNRTINGSTRRYVEFMMPHEIGDQEDLFFVQSGLTYDGSPVTTLTNLDHLEGQSVQILADGAVHPNRTVTAGAITLDYAASVVQVGLGYDSTIKTMDLEGASFSGTSQTKVTHIGKVSLRFLDTLGCKFGDGVTMDTIPFRTSSMPMNQPPTIFTGDKEVQFPSGHVKNKHIVIKQTQPLPLHLLGIFPRMMVAD